MTQPLEMVRMLYNALGLMHPDIEWMHAGLALSTGRTRSAPGRRKCPNAPDARLEGFRRTS